MPVNQEDAASRVQRKRVNRLDEIVQNKSGLITSAVSFKYQVTMLWGFVSLCKFIVCNIPAIIYRDRQRLKTKVLGEERMQELD
ncbi:MAG: hypothetical protein GWO30_04605 [Gammaproteobacteria bacterium]|nr:hypothetical protein [Gammaproteobacteria bacterium]NIR51140.1 hypothetical protein [candidate division KSB1 bacterium]NIV70485.1 hypothetical protein [Phycisphaerae bacterium]NIU27201.1 hypothetical protein [candidate division KSB1 bacterium]NIW21091.1 hypothetical protein [candidate division KSB1 bacterium]